VTLLMNPAQEICRGTRLGVDERRGRQEVCEPNALSVTADVRVHRHKAAMTWSHTPLSPNCLYRGNTQAFSSHGVAQLRQA
jgi:hypothetical protein